MPYQRVLDFWFQDTSPDLWFAQNDDFDHKIRQEFYSLWQSACRAELAAWRTTIHGRLAEIIVLDQFSQP